MTDSLDEGLGHYLKRIMGDANYAATRLSLMLEKLGLKNGFTSINGKTLIGVQKRNG